MSEEFSAEGHDSVVLTLCDAAVLGNAREAEERLRAQIEDAGGRVVSLGLDARRRPWSGARAMRPALRRIRPDVIHAHTARALPMLALNHGTAPVVLTHHNSRLGFPPSMFRVFDRLADHYVAISQETQRILSHHARRPVTYIPNAAGKGFSAASPRTAPASPLRVLSVGAISDQKNYPLLIETVRTMRDLDLVRPLPVFRVAGNGILLAGMRNAVSELGLADNLQFLGERGDIAALMADSDVFLNTSLYEGMPIALLEAMRSALPIVATDVAGNRELVRAETNGLLAPLDPTRLAGDLARLAGDGELYARLSAGALRLAEEYSIGGTARRHLALYGAEIGRHRPRVVANSPNGVSLK